MVNNYEKKLALHTVIAELNKAHYQSIIKLVIFFCFVELCKNYISLILGVNPS